MGRRKKRKESACAYCGKVGIMTDDHVIPQCLFVGGMPANNVQVPACQRCNSEKAKDDDYLRDFLISDFYACHHPAAHTLIRTKLFRSIQGNRSTFFRDAKAYGRYEPMYSMGGIYLAEAFGVPLEIDRVKRIFSTIVRGLYYKIHSKRIPDDYVFRVQRWDYFYSRRFWPVLQEAGINGPYRCGNVFECFMARAQEDEFYTCWWLRFYDGLYVYIDTTPPEQKEDEKQCGPEPPNP